MANDFCSSKQSSFYKSLCEDLGQDADTDFENKSTAEASKAIKELLEMKQEHKDKFEGKGKDDDGFWWRK